ncbi:MAG: PAS domain S-box protein [Gemmatimonadales bacterium]
MAATPERLHARTARHRGVPLWGVGLGAPAFALLWLLRRYGYVAHVSLALVLGEFVLILGGMAAFTSLFPPGTPRARPRLHLFLQLALIGLIVYTLGWGSMLAVGFIVPAANIMNSDGSKYGPWAMASIALTTAVGELAVALGWAHAILPGRVGHTLAVLEVAAACAVVWIMCFHQRDKEQIAQAVVEGADRFRALVQHAPDMIIVVSSEGFISYASPAVEATLGYPPAETVGMPSRHLIADYDFPAL